MCIYLTSIRLRKNGFVGWSACKVYDRSQTLEVQKVKSYILNIVTFFRLIYIKKAKPNFAQLTSRNPCICMNSITVPQVPDFPNVVLI